MSDDTFICWMCGYPFEPQMDKDIRMTNTTPNISPSLDEHFIVTCPHCHLQYDLTTGREVLFSDV